MGMDRRKFLEDSSKMVSAGLIAGAAVAAAEAATQATKSARKYRLIATEEAFSIPEQVDGFRHAAELSYSNPDLDMWRAFLKPASGAPPLLRRLLDLEGERIQIMDQSGVAMHVLSLTSPGVQTFNADFAANLATLANDKLAEVIRKHPKRFTGLASFAPQDPKGAAKEIDRAINKLKLNGLIVNSHTNGEYLDDRKYWPIFEAACAAITRFADGHDAVVNDLVGADGLGFLQFLVGTGGGNDVSAKEFCDLNSGAADTAAGRKDQNGFAGAKLCTVGQHVPSGEEHERNRGGMNPVEVLGIGHAIHLGAADIFGATAIDHETEVGEIATEVVVAGQTSGATPTSNTWSQDHFLADVNVVNIVANLDDFTGYVAAGNMRKRDRIVGKAMTDPEVEMVESARAHADEYFVWVNVRLVDFGVVQDAGVTMFVKDNGFHLRPP